MEKKQDKKEFKAVMTVTRKIHLTPHYISVYLGGTDISFFEQITVGVHNKIMIPPAGLTDFEFPEFDGPTRKWANLADGSTPTIRTYTHRGVDLSKKEIRIDFVAHGDEGPASAWAIAAKPGDKLGVMIRAESGPLVPQADDYLLIGDATAIPVIGAILESLPAGRNVTCIIEVHGPGDEQVLHSQAKVEIKWLHNTYPQDGSRLSEELKGTSLPDSSRFAFVAAEFSTVRSIRHHLRNELGWKREELDAYAYWKSGFREDRSASERHQEGSSD